MAGQLSPGEALADRFRSTGAHVIVTKSPASAISLVQHAKVDLVFVSYMLQDPELMKVLKLRGVPFIICATPASMDEFADSIGDAMHDHTQPTSSRLPTVPGASSEIARLTVNSSNIIAARRMARRFLKSPP